MVPSVGRIVHYRSFGTPGGEYTSVCRAAVITEVGLDSPGHEGRVGLCILNPKGAFFTDCDYHPGSPVEGWIGIRRGDYVPGTWHWPERVEE
jgi:hypothetical protein